MLPLLLPQSGLGAPSLATAYFPATMSMDQQPVISCLLCTEIRLRATEGKATRIQKERLSP
jgi:hypothetical protein